MWSFILRKVFHAQERQAVMPRIGARVVHDRAPLQVTHELQDPAEAERDAVLQHPHRLRAEDFRVPAGSLREIAARHRDVGDIAHRPSSACCPAVPRSGSSCVSASAATVQSDFMPCWLRPQIRTPPSAPIERRPCSISIWASSSARGRSFDRVARAARHFAARLDVPAIPAQHRRADVRAARLERMRASVRSPAHRSRPPPASVSASSFGDSTR